MVLHIRRNSRTLRRVPNTPIPSRPLHLQDRRLHRSHKSKPRQIPRPECKIMRICPEGVHVITRQALPWHPPLTEATVRCIEHLELFQPSMHLGFVNGGKTQGCRELFLDRPEQGSRETHELMEPWVNSGNRNLIYGELPPHPGYRRVPLGLI